MITIIVRGALIIVGIIGVICSGIMAYQGQLLLGCIAGSVNLLALTHNIEQLRKKLNKPVEEIDEIGNNSEKDEK
jgi:hypothetical protein